MAEFASSDSTEESLPDFGLKCGQCRSGFLVKISDKNSQGFLTTSDLYVIRDEELPEWISEKIEEAGWTKGRLNCPKCQNRVGGFDFVSGAEHPIHLIKSKVDLWKKALILSSTAESSVQDLVSSGLSESSSPCSTLSTSSSWSSSSTESASTSKGCFLDSEQEPNSSDYEMEQKSSKKKRKLRKKRRRHMERNRDVKSRENRRQKLIKEILDAEPELDDLDSSLICPVCLDLLFAPYNVIPCKHTFCETCLRRIGSKDPMNTFCPMCRQRIVYCESQSELALSIKESYPDLYQKRRTSEKSTNVYEMPLPWRPGWRNLVSGRALGGNRMGASTLFDYLKTIVQLLPYYIPPVVIANLINMIFFFFLLGAVEVIPILSGLLQKSANKVLNSKIETSLNVQQNFLDHNMGMSPNTFLQFLQSSFRSRKSLMDEVPLPPTYLPPESTQAMDATFYYVVGGMTLLAAAFGNIIILNFDD